MSNSLTLTWSSNWIEAISDDAPISEVNIPGSHESCARMWGANYECQWHSIINQLRRGIRFLDIRCVYKLEPGDTNSGETEVFFPVYHGAHPDHRGYQYITFEEVQAQCIAFLEANPREFILLNLQMEFLSDGTTAEMFRDKFWQLIQPYKKYWKLDDPTVPQTECIAKNQGTPDECRRRFVPTMGDCRGHIVLIRAYRRSINGSPVAGWPGFPAVSHPPRPNVPLGMPWEGFTEPRTTADNLFVTQNYWELGNSDKKLSYVEDAIVHAEDRARAGYITLNFASYATLALPPGPNAAWMNPKLQAYLLDDSKDGGFSRKVLGVIALDFVSNTGTTPPNPIVSGNALENLIIMRQPHQMPSYVFGGTDPSIWDAPFNP